MTTLDKELHDHEQAADASNESDVARLCRTGRNTNQVVVNVLRDLSIILKGSDSAIMARAAVIVAREAGVGV